MSCVDVAFVIKHSASPKVILLFCTYGSNPLPVKTIDCELDVFILVTNGVELSNQLKSQLRTH